MDLNKKLEKLRVKTVKKIEKENKRRTENLYKVYRQLESQILKHKKTINVKNGYQC